MSDAELREILKGLRFVRGYADNCREHAHAVRRLRERDRFQHIAKELDGLERSLVALGERLNRDDEVRKTLRLWTGLLAKLAAETPQFSNPLVIWQAQSVRDEILRLGVDGAIEAHVPPAAEASPMAASQTLPNAMATPEGVAEGTLTNE